MCMRACVYVCMYVCMYVLLIEASFEHWGLCISRESKNHVSVGPVSIWDVNAPP